MAVWKSSTNIFTVNPCTGNIMEMKRTKHSYREFKKLGNLSNHDDNVNGNIAKQKV